MGKIVDTQLRRHSKFLLLLISRLGFVVCGTIEPSEAFPAEGPDLGRRGKDLYRAAVAEVDVTPDYPIRLNGFGNRRNESEGVSQRIFARALAIQAAGVEDPPVVLVTLDNLGIRTAIHDFVTGRIHETHGVPSNRIAITFTHTHCAPKLNGSSDNIFSEPIPADHQVHIDQYTEDLKRQLVSVISSALDRMRPVRLEWGIGSVGFAKNRRTPNGPVDHSLPTLVVRDIESGKPVAIYVTYACHAVTLSFNRISGDWAGHAAEMIKRRFPGVTAMVSIGAGSDQNPASGVTGDRVDVARGQGLQIADEVQRLVQEGLKPVSGAIRARLNRIPLPLESVPTREQLLLQVEKGSAPVRHNARTHLERLERGEELTQQIDYTVQSWAFGDSLCMVFLAGEVCVDYAVRLKKQFDRNRFWLMAYSNDFCSYIPSERLVNEGGYGGGAEIPYFALPAKLAGGLEQRIIDEVTRQVSKEFETAPGTQGVPPQNPADSLKCLQVTDGLEISLVASEPQVSDPVAIDFGTDGRLWVAEMNDYGRDVYEAFEQRGRIRWLRDTDHDGFFETAETFVDGLRFPTDVKVWRNGVLICDAPDILFAEDLDGDGKAEHVRTLFSGFEVRNAQARVNSLRYDLDHQLRGAGGLFGGEILSHVTGTKTDCRNRDFRLDVDAGIIEAIDGRTQQGSARNDWGDWFGCTNGSLMNVLSNLERYRQRNPSTVIPLLPRVEFDPEALKLYPPDGIVTFELTGPPGRPTSACGLGVYRDHVLGADYRNDVFTCEPVHQSVHRIDLESTANGYRADRAKSETEREFLSSTDQWFRPVQVRTGPDGALWVVDMYRYVIEHSRWIPAETLEDLNIMAGRGRGRIYRVFRPDIPALNSAQQRTTGSGPLIPNLADLTDTQLAKRLESTNGIIRDLTQQMLLWRNAKSIGPRISGLINSGDPVVAIQCLWTLRGLGLLTAEHVADGLANNDPAVQRHAVLLSEPLLNNHPGLIPLLVELTDSMDERLRQQVALSLGQTGHSDSAAGLVLILNRSGESDAVKMAALNSVTASNLSQVLDGFFSADEESADSRASRQLIVQAVRNGDAELRKQILRTYLVPPRQLPEGTELQFWLDLIRAYDDRSERKDIAEIISLADSIHQLFVLAGQIFDAHDGSEADCIAALKLLGKQPGGFSRGVIEQIEPSKRRWTVDPAAATAGFLSPRFPQSVQEAALAGLASHDGKAIFPHLLEAYGSLNPNLRQQVIRVLCRNQIGQETLLEAVSSRQIRPDALDAAARNLLLMADDSEIRGTAERLLTANAISDRAVVIEKYLAALDNSGIAERGRLVFEKRCAQCHQLNGRGHVVGPDLAALTFNEPQQLVREILDPNARVDERYLAWTGVTVAGRTYSGILVRESTSVIELREAGGRIHQLPRDSLEELVASGRSFMPEGLERDLTVEDMCDLIAYLGQFEPPPKTLAGNTPRLMTGDPGGSIRMPASAAEIRGTSITYEQPFQNIGYWHAIGDTVRWTIDVPADGQFRLYLQASCADESAGTGFRIDGLGVPLEGRMIGTGGWDRFTSLLVGKCALRAGRYRVSVQATEPIVRALFDLREVQLVPEGQSPVFAPVGGKAEAPRSATQIAAALLDGGIPMERRSEFIELRPGLGPAVIAQLTDRWDERSKAARAARIPWIWRVAVSVAKRNDGGEIRDLLVLSVPSREAKLRDWQAVVIGGGLVNGLSGKGVRPGDRLAEIMAQLPSVNMAWSSLLHKAAAMASDETVVSGTRYDAIRILGLDGSPEAIVVLNSYLHQKTNVELRHGAVHALVDLNSRDSILSVLSRWDDLDDESRRMALEGLLRSQEGRRQIVGMIRQKRMQLTPLEQERLRTHREETVRKHFHEVWNQSGENSSDSGTEECP